MDAMIWNNKVKATFVSCLLLACSQSLAADGQSVNPDMQKQDLTLLKQKVEAFLNTQTIGYPGEVSVRAGAIDRNLKLANCPAAEVFLPAGSRAWGKTSVAIHCAAPVAWTIYVQATISVMADYFVAAMPLGQGHIMMNQDLLKVKGDLTKLPAGIFTDPSQVIGRSVSISLTAGSVLRQEMLKMPLAVQQGQTVTITSNGNGFQVSAEGKALTTATEGQSVQVKVASGEVIAGIARLGGQVEVAF